MTFQVGITDEGDVVLMFDGVEYDATVDEVTGMALDLLRAAFYAKMKQTARTN